MAKADVNARRHQLLHARDTATLRIVVKASLEVNIDQWVSDEVNAGELQQTKKT